MAIDSSDLREVDRIVLDCLQEGRVTPAHCRDRIADVYLHNEVTATYCGQRLKRLEEHGYVENLYDNGLYELLEDPRADDE